MAHRLLSPSRLVALLLAALVGVTLLVLPAQSASAATTWGRPNCTVAKYYGNCDAQKWYDDMVARIASKDRAKIGSVMVAIYGPVYNQGGASAIINLQEKLNTNRGCVMVSLYRAVDQMAHSMYLLNGASGGAVASKSATTTIYQRLARVGALSPQALAVRLSAEIGAAQYKQLVDLAGKVGQKQLARNLVVEGLGC